MNKVKQNPWEIFRGLYQVSEYEGEQLRELARKLVEGHNVFSVYATLAYYSSIVEELKTYVVQELEKNN